MQKELINNLLERLKTSTETISFLAEHAITEKNFPDKHARLKEIIKKNSPVIQEAEKLRNNNYNS